MSKRDALRAAREARAAKSANRGHVQVTADLRIREIDDRNWGTEVSQGKGWRTMGYYPNLRSALRGMAKHMLDQEHRRDMTEHTELWSVAAWLEGCEARVISALSALDVLSRIA